MKNVNLAKKNFGAKIQICFSSSDCKIIKSYNCICHFHRSAKKTASCGRLWLEGSTVLSLQRSNWKWRKISLFMAINQIHLPCYFFCATTPNHIMRAKTSLIHCWSSSDQGLVYHHFYLSLVCCYCTIKCKQSSLSLMMANRHLISKTFFFLARLETHSIKHVYVNHCLAFSRNVGTKKGQSKIG